MFTGSLNLILGLALGGLLNASSAEFRLDVDTSSDGTGLLLSTEGPLETVHTIEISKDLSTWDRFLTTHDAFREYPVGADQFEGPRFFRAKHRPKTDADDWKNQIVFPRERLLSPLDGRAIDEVRWVKFAILLDDPDKVIFQDSRKYPFHFDFARTRISRFANATPQEFDQASLYLANQSVQLGAVLMPWPEDENEFAIQFVCRDPLPADLVANYYEVVKSAIAVEPGSRAFYFPTFEQLAVVEENPSFFTERGIDIGTPSRWLSGDQIYSEGWALGTLKHFPTDQIDAAFSDGRLTPSDILITDAVPAEIPFLAGIITLAPTTPNSHVAILARSFQIPFAHPVAEAQQRALSLVNHKVAYRAYSGFAGGTVDLIDLEDRLSPTLEQRILDLKTPPDLDIQPTMTSGSFSVATDQLTPDDVRHVGGKAANFGFLRRAIPDHSPEAIAFTFDLWDSFMDQSMGPDATLRSVIADRLASHTYPPNIASLKADLLWVRELIKDETVLTSEQETAILDALSGFDTSRKIRFRSSTNVEDTEHFSGAGLYDSYSGCADDDLDNDDEGPSACDPLQPKERGVFRAIRKVFASFYNDNAFLERLRHGIDENDVGMALLVHHSFPDETELANGVSTLTARIQGDSLQLSGDMVTQLGAAPVTNPAGSALPEIVGIQKYSFGTYLAPSQWSGLLPLGRHVMEFEDDYRSFVDLFASVAAAYSEHHPGRTPFNLDFEYKKTAADGLIVKQVREVPTDFGNESVVPFIVDEPVEFSVFQGERGDVFSNHRLKSLWQFSVYGARLDDAGISDGILASADHRMAESGNVAEYSGNPALWPNASRSIQGSEIRNHWARTAAESTREFTLTTRVEKEIASNRPPILRLADFEMELIADYDVPQPKLDYDGTPMTTVQDFVALVPTPGRKSSDLPQHRTLTFGDSAITIDIRFNWPHEPLGPVAGYTAPLTSWEQTTITGLTSEPIVLTGEFSQTYRPGHHNFTEEFIFEPRLEEGVSQAILDELDTSNIRLLHVTTGLLNAPLRILGTNNRFREMD